MSIPALIKDALRDTPKAEALKRRARAGELRARAVSHYVARGHAVRRRTIHRYLQTASEPRLQVGAGSYPLPGWLNSDLVSGEIYLDITRPIAAPDSAFEFIFGEHVIEHVPEAAGRTALAQFHRILQPGGVLRLTTPDLRRHIEIYEDRNPVVSQEDYARFLDNWTRGHHERPCQVFNGAMRYWGHQYVYDEEDLTAKLRAAGFTDVERVEPGESRHGTLRGLERHGPEWLNRAEAMCLEATKAHEKPPGVRPLAPTS